MQVGGGGERMVESCTTASKQTNILQRPSDNLHYTDSITELILTLEGGQPRQRKDRLPDFVVEPPFAWVSRSFACVEQHYTESRI